MTLGDAGSAGTDANLEQILRAEIAEQKGIIHELRANIQKLQSVIATLQRKLFGASTEKVIIPPVDPMQTSLFDPDSLGIPREVPAPAPEPETAQPAQRRSRPLGVAERCPGLKIEEHNAQPPAEVAALVENGELRLERTGTYSDELVARPAKPFIRRTFHCRVVQTATDTPTITIGPADKIVPGSEVADTTIHTLMVGKFLDAIPFNRQLDAWARQGAMLARQTVGDHFQAWATFFGPLAATIKEMVLAAEVVHADDSWFRVRDPELQRKCKASNIWGLLGDGLVAYTFTPDNTHARVEAVLGPNFTGYLVCDQWGGWKKVPDAVLVGCNAHARRPFAAHGDDPWSQRMLPLFTKLYAVERDARDTGLLGKDLFAERQRLRQERSAGIMDAIRDLAQEIVTFHHPNDALRRGAKYIITHQQVLRRSLSNGMLPIDNNPAENALRINALLRKNSLFLGAESAGPNMATALTILHSCKLAGLNPHTYLDHITPILLAHRYRMSTLDLRTLAPTTLAKSHPELVANQHR